MLRGCTFTYYTDHQTMQEPKGELLVFAETKLQTMELSGQKFCFSLMKPFPALHLAAESADDVQIWVKAFAKAIMMAQKGLRNYMTKYINPRDGLSKKKFFILHQDAITIHRDSESISVVQGLIHLNDNSFCEYYDRSLRITVVDTVMKHSLTLQFYGPGARAPQDGDYNEWKNALISNLRLYTALVQNAEASINTTQGIPNQIKQGLLRMRPPKGGEIWPQHHFFINEHAMIVVDSEPEDKTNARIIGEYAISPNCSVFETNLGQFTFELVTAKKVLHVQAPTAQELVEWVEAVREAIARSFLDTTDPLFQQAMMRIDDDVCYTVQFNEKRPLGVVFERSGDWAIIKSSSNADETGILVGSVLSKIDQDSYILDNYQNAIDRLKKWNPPLSLTFRRAPAKNGFLLKESRSRSNPQKKVWKKRYFMLGEGRLHYKDSPEADARVKGECPLMGSVVSLIKEGEAGGKRNCFRLMSGMMYLTLQCANEKQMMDWASAMYHAISIANGGAYILQYERDRLAAQVWWDWHGTALHCTVLHCTALHCTALHCTAFSKCLLVLR